MHRSIPVLVSLCNRRSLSTSVPPSRTVVPPNSSTTSSSAAVPPPPPPPGTPPPPRRRGFIRRSIPLALIAGVGYVSYRVTIDNEFRSTVKEAFPFVEKVLQYLPQAPPTFTSKENGLQLPDTEPVPKIVLRIEETNPSMVESNVSTMPSEEVGKAQNTGDRELENLTPSERAAAKARTDDSADDKNGFSSGAIEKAPDTDVKPVDVEPADPQRVIDLEIVGKDTVSNEIVSEPSADTRNEEVDVVKPVFTDDMDTTTFEILTQLESDGKEVDHDLEANHSELYKAKSGKSKLARLLGKPDFDPQNLGEKEVVDNSIFEKPKVWLTEESDVAPKRNQDAGSTQPESKTDSSSEKVEESGTHKSTAEQKIPEEKEFAPSISVERKTGKIKEASSNMLAEQPETKKSDNILGHGEAEALRAELASQTKWEAVRLQEAVRSQLIEDKKAAAKEIANLKHQHSEEIARVREEAVTETKKMVEEKAREVASRHEKSREKEVKRMMRERETELREELIVEFTEREAENSHKRSTALTKAEAEVTALSKRFDAVVAQTERAKEATQRTSGAFVLHEAMRSGEGLNVALKVASSQSELGALMAQSVPATAVQNGIKSLDGLREDFVQASRQGLSVATVPETKAGSIWAHALASAFSRLKLNVDIRADGISEPRSNEERIRLAQFYVKEGNLLAAVKTLDPVDGLAGDVLKDWLRTAKSRIAVSMAADVLLADAIVSQATLMKAE